MSYEIPTTSTRQTVTRGIATQHRAGTPTVAFVQGGKAGVTGGVICYIPARTRTKRSLVKPLEATRTRGVPCSTQRPVDGLLHSTLQRTLWNTV